ncbi:MAG: hypothetical protein E3J64_07845 [Anaerolineales bacterium]|nr:MAG: hypothetical protein E3J64_07845 [Anaerolineales bacterium]
MTVLLQYLSDNAWLAYIACAAGIVYYMRRALRARQVRSRAMFTVERESESRRVTQAWVMTVIVALVGVAVFATATFVIPALDSAASPLVAPTRASGVDQPTVTREGGSTPAATLSTVTPTPTREPVPTTAPPATSGPTEEPQGGPTGDVNVQFGDFALLLRYELPSIDVTTTQSVELTLTWEALEGVSPKNYMVFTHLFAESGELLGQHDSEPGGGNQPMMLWTVGEVIIDAHSIRFQNPSYVGPAYFIVGLYDAEAGRALTETGADNVVLPVTIDVVAE